jgi:hypothetical protein
MSAQRIPSFHLLHSNPPIRKQKVGIMSRISRVLFPESLSLSRTSSPTRDRVSGVDSLAGMTHDTHQLGAHANDEKENDNRNKNKRRNRRNKPQSRVQMSSSKSLGNSLMNIGQCQVVEKKKEMDSNKSRIRTSPSSKMSTNPFGVFAVLGNLNPQSNRKKKRNRVSFVVETKNDSKSKRDERQRNRAASREKSVDREAEDENDCPGVIFESDDADVVVSPVSIPRTKRMDQKQHTPVQTHESCVSSKRRSKQEVDEEILSPSIAPKPLKRKDNRATPDLKASQSSQILFTEASHNFDEIHAEAQAILRAAEQARSIVSVTDISGLSPDEIESIARIQAKAIVAANPEISLPKNSKNTKPNSEQINHQIDLQTKALLHAYTTALRSIPRIDTYERFEEFQQGKVTNTLETDAVVSPERHTNTCVDIMIEQDSENDAIEFDNNEEDEIDHVSKESIDETEHFDVAPMKESSNPDEEISDVPDSLTKEENHDNAQMAPMIESSKPHEEISHVPDSVDKEKDNDNVSDGDKQIDAVQIADGIEITQSSILNNVTNQHETLHEINSCDAVGQEVQATLSHHNGDKCSKSTNDNETKQSELNSELDQLQKHTTINSVDNIPTSESNVSNEYKSYIGRRVAGYFPRFKKYYRGTVVKFYKNDEEVLFRIKYDDGDEEFINYSDENAVEGRDLKRLLENFEKYGEESISKPKDKKKQRTAKLAETKKAKENECHNNTANVSKRPKRHVRQVDRLELTFRRKKKKQTDKSVSIEDSNIQNDEKGEYVHNQIAEQNSYICSTTSQQMQKGKNSLSEENAQSEYIHSNAETNAYLKLREERIARNQEKLKELGLSVSIEKTPKKKVNKSTHCAPQTTLDEKEKVPRRSVRHKNSTTPSIVDDNEEIRVEEIFEEQLDEDGWNTKTISLLKKAYTTTDPLAANFWGKIAETVGDRTGEECRDKWFSLSTVHDIKKSKVSSESKNLDCLTNDDQDEDDIFNSTPYRENRMKVRLNSPSQSRKPLSRLSDIFSSPIFNRLNAKTKNEGSVDDENETPRRFRSQYKSYVKEIKAGAIGKFKRPKGKKKVAQLLPKSRLCASAESGEIQVRGVVSPGGTFKLDEPDLDEIENAFLYEDELDNVSDNCSVY